MKKLHSIAALLLALVMLFSMVACQSTGTKDPEKTDAPTDTVPESETEPQETQPEEKSPIEIPEGPFALLFTAAASVKAGNMTIDVPVTASIAFVSEECMRIDFAYDLMNDYNGFSIYFDGETLYINANGDLVKVEKDEMQDLIGEAGIPGLEEDSEFTMDEETAEKIEQIFTAVLETIGEYTEVTEDGDDVITTVNMPKEGFMTLFGKLAAIAGEELDEDMIAQIEAAEIGNLECRVITRNGVFAEMNASFSIGGISFDEKTTASLSIEMSLMLTATGEDVEVEIPENLEEYVPYKEFNGEGEDEPSEEEKAVAEILALLYDEEMNPVENYEEVYAQCVETYGQELVDEAVNSAEAFVIMAKIMELYGEDLKPVEGYEEALDALRAEYGEELVDEYVAYIEALLSLFGDIDVDETEAA